MLNSNVCQQLKICFLIKHDSQPCSTMQRETKGLWQIPRTKQLFYFNKEVAALSRLFKFVFFNQEVKSGVWKIGGPKENPRKHIENMQTSNRAKPIGLLLWNDFNHRATVRFDLLVCFTVWVYS